MGKQGPEPGFADVLTRQDELMVKQEETLDEIESDIDDMSEMMETLVRVLGDATGADVGEPRAGEVVTLELSKNVSKDTTPDNPVTKSTPVPFDGKVIGIVPGWPDGANNVGGISLLHESIGGETVDKLFPFNESDSYVAANDFTTMFEANFNIESGERLVGRFVNNDESNDHFLNLLVVFEEE